MLFYSISTLLTASALSSIHVTPLQLTRCATLIFLSAGVMAANTLNVSAMGPGLSLFVGILQITPFSQSVNTFINVVASVIVGLVWTPVSYKKTIKRCSDSVLSKSIQDYSDSIKPYISAQHYTNEPAVKRFSDSVKTYIPAVAEYSVILLFTTLGATILVSGTSLVTVYLGVELQSFAVYILSALY